MAFLEHLDELRTRLIYAIGALVAGMIVSFLFVNRIAQLVMTPMLAALPSDATLIYTKPGEGFAFYFDLALMGGAILAAPAVTYQAWRFVAPGLYANERRLAVPFLLLALCGSIAGAYFSHRVLFPGMMAFFRAFDSPTMRFMPRIEDTFALYKNTLLCMVGVFQIPTLVFVLAKVRVVTAGLLWRHVKHALLIAVIAAAVLTPSSDPWNQIVFAAPIIAMYVIGIGIAWLAHPGRARRGDGNAAVGVVCAAGLLQTYRRLHHAQWR
jgi:sec-independent protein translocase protein TatC